MAAGRKPLSISHLVDRLEGSPVAKERLRVILANVSGQMTVAQACEALGIEASWFFELKHESLDRWLKALEPDQPGRRPAAATTPEQQRIADLEEQNQQLELKLQAVELRAELARAGLSRRTGDTERAAKKAKR
jgi:transposase-like protein